MKPFMIWIISLCMALPLTGFAQDFSGQKNLICSVAQVVECAPGQDCFQGTAVNFEFPDFFRIDVKEKQVIATSRNQQVRTSPIETVKTLDQSLIITGSQSGRAWHMVISRTTGRYTGIVAAPDFSFSIFGACIRP